MISPRHSYNKVIFRGGILLKRTKKNRIIVFVIAILIPLAVGGLSALISREGIETYATLVKPAFAPPAIVFPIVWTVLYVLMGVSSALVALSNDPRKGESLTVYALQLGVNFLWTPIFFLAQARLLAFFWLLLLILFVSLMIVLFARGSKIAARIQIPYLIWCVFAAALNFSVWQLNG